MQNSEESGLTRRRVVTGLLAGAGGAGAIVYYGAQPALAITSNFASDVSVSTNDGTITNVSLGSGMSVTLSWDGLDVAPATADVTINVKSADAGVSSFNKLIDVSGFTLTDNSLSGSDTIAASDFGKAPFDIIGAAGGGNISTDDFESTTDGDTKDTTVTLQVEATIYDSGGAVIESNTSTDSYVVSVTNTSSTSSTSGTADTQVSG